MIAETTVHDTTEAREFFSNKLAFTTGPIEVSHEIEQGSPAIFDVRAPNDFKEGHVPGAINLPESQWENSDALRRQDANIFYCYSQTCHLAARAARHFAEQGFPVREMEGGFEAWKQNGLTIER